MITATPLQAFEDNYIWLLRGERGGPVAVVDPGDAEPVEALLEREGVALEAILVTHHHYDHTGGVAELAARHGAPVYGPAGERIPARSHGVREGDEVVLPGCGARLAVLDLPGHTAGHVGYFGHGLLFCGDTLFTAGCGRLFEGTAEQMHRSLTKLAALPPATAVHCAHEYTLANLAFAEVAEPDNEAIRQRRAAAAARRAAGLPTVPSTLAEELATNPFLRCGEAALIAAAERFAGRRLPGGAEVFATVRHWKDTLD